MHRHVAIVGHRFLFGAFFLFLYPLLPCDDVTRTHEHTRTNGTHKVYTYILDKIYMFIKYSAKTIRKKTNEEGGKKKGKTKQCHQGKWEDIQQ